MNAVIPTLVTHDPFSHAFLDGHQDVTELVLIRHGQAISDGKLPDLIDPSLTEVGRLQAESLAERLGDQEFAAIYASPMKRAIETASPLAGRIGLGVQRHEGLREVTFRLDGASPDDIASLASGFNGQLGQAKRGEGGRFSWDQLPLTEASAPFRRRVLEAMEQIRGAHAGLRVAIVCHAGVINAYTSHVLGIESDMFFLPLNTSITVVRTMGAHHVVHRLNDYEHLLRS